MTRAARAIRLAAGTIVLAALGAAGLVLIPSYTANWKLQRYLDQVCTDPASATRSPESLRAEVITQAASLGLPVRSNDVNVAFTHGSLRIDVLYLVHVDVAGYTVDLHFRPRAAVN